MSAQPDLFRQAFRPTKLMRRIETPAARLTDPISSHIAADDHTASGRRHSNAVRLLEAFRRQPGMTSAEAALAADMTRHEAARRAPELKTAGELRQGDLRRCSVCNRRCVTWWPL